MIHCGVAASQITRVFLTHFHGDHCLGFAGIVQRISLDRVPHTIPAYYPASGQKYFDRLRHASIYRDFAKIEQRPITEEGEIDRDERFVVTALALSHGVDTFGYRLVEPDGVTMLPDKLEAAGVRGPAIRKLMQDGVVDGSAGQVPLGDVSVPRRGKKIAFVMDTRVCDNAFELARDADVLICESTYLATEATEAQERGHLTAGDAARIAHEAGAGRLILTHFSQRYESVAPFVEEAGAIHSNVVALSDGDCVDLRTPLEG